MKHSPTDILGDQSSQGAGNFWLVNGRETKPRPPLKGLISLSPCKDGTLFASAYTRTVAKSTSGDHFLFEAKDSLASYTTKYSIDLKAGRLNVDPWVKCGGVALQVQKMPIPCWSQFESLNGVLQAKLPPDDDACGYNNPSRAVLCEADQIMIVSGSQVSPAEASRWLRFEHWQEELFHFRRGVRRGGRNRAVHWSQCRSD